MAWSEAEVVCKRHPTETPQPGVCPSCLRERLLRIAGNSRIKNSCSSSPPSFSASPVHYYYYSPASSSGCSPQSSRRRQHRRVGSDIMDSIYFAMSGKNGLTKSRSMANYASRNIGARDHHGINRKKKGGFWSKLLLRYSVKKAKC